MARNGHARAWKKSKNKDKYVFLIHLLYCYS